MILLSFLGLLIVGMTIHYLREERVAHSTWTISSASLGGVDLAQCFLRAAKRRGDAYDVGDETLILQPPDRQWLMTLSWADRADGSGIAEMALDRPPPMKRIGSTDLGLAIDLIQQPWFASDRMRRFLREVRKLDPSADVGSRRTPYV